MTRPFLTTSENVSGALRSRCRPGRQVGAAGASALLAIAVVTAGAGAAYAAPRSHGVKPSVVHEDLVLLTGKMDGKKGSPEFVGGSDIQWPSGTTVVLTIYSYDDGTAPLTKPLSVYDAVQGTIGNRELVDGKKVSSVRNADIAHTFTVPSVGLNIPIPAAPAARRGEALQPEVVTATFRVPKTGTFTWHCYAPCGSGPDGMEGAMATNGWMTGNVTFS